MIDSGIELNTHTLPPSDCILTARILGYPLALYSPGISYMTDLYQTALMSWNTFLALLELCLKNRKILIFFSELFNHPRNENPFL